MLLISLRVELTPELRLGTPSLTKALILSYFEIG